MINAQAWILSGALVFTVGLAHAGGPKDTHPCYGVADCKSQTSKETFSKCVKANVDQANQIPQCADFRNDKKAYMKEHGIDGVDSLFN
ncbi:MAG: hypothetical protein U9R74_09680 [Pseudomonadota bacterium]|nr:hypothetical protein [Pseudomonadota bacterium]